jgi:DNA-binding winged helix-turn-helix (wHTH) protein/tetratricopeptide (TPR) repeat protein
MIYEFPPFHMDSIARILRRVGEPASVLQVPLPPRAFDLLHCLVSNAGRLITHDELMSKLWPDMDVQPEVIKAQILLVRKALDDDSGRPRFVETVRGAGYRFIASVKYQDEQSAGVEIFTHSIVGRENSLAELDACLRDCLKGSLKLVLVSGEPGLGKTTVINEFVMRAAASAELLQVSGQCIENRGAVEPYYPVLEALGRACKAGARHHLLELLITLAPSWATQLPAYVSPRQRAELRREIGGAGRERMLREIWSFLEAASARVPIVLILEDLHWSDFSTVDFLSAMARQSGTVRLLIVGSYRPEEANAAGHPVKDLAAALSVRQLCREVVLTPLTERDIATYLGSWTDSDSFASWMQRLSGGNPLFMTATLRYLAEHDLIEEINHVWRPKVALRQIGSAIPQTLNKVIEARIRRLSDAQQSALQAAAIQGLSFQAQVAGSAAGLEPEDFEDVCEELCRREAFIERDEPSGYRFRHSMYRAVLYGRIGPLRRANGHRKIGTRLEEFIDPARRAEAAAELAHHFTAGEEWSRAMTYLRLALQTARQRFANNEAIEILDRATALLDRLSPEERTDQELALLEVNASVFMVEHDPRAIEIYEKMIGMAREVGRVDLAARILPAYAYAISWSDRDKALSVLNEALETSERQSDGVMRARTQVSVHAWRIWIGGWNEEDARKAEKAFEHLRMANDPVASGWASLEFSTTTLVASQYERTRHLIAEAYKQLHLSASSRPDFSVERAVWSYFFGFPLSLLLLGKLGEALRGFDDGIALFSRNNNRYAVATLRLHRAWLLHHCGDYAGVISECREASSSRSVPDSSTNSAELPIAEQRLATLLAGLANAALGRSDEAWQELSELARSTDDQPVIFSWYWRLPLERGRAMASLALGQIENARACADLVVQLASQTQERTWQSLAWETSAQVALREGHVEMAVRHIEEALRIAEQFEVPLADWRVFGTAAHIYAASGRLSDARKYSRKEIKRRTDLTESLPNESYLRSTFSAVRGDFL